MCRPICWLIRMIGSPLLLQGWVRRRFWSSYLTLECAVGGITVLWGRRWPVTSSHYWSCDYWGDSWMDWSTFATKSMDLSGLEDSHRIHYLFVAGVCCQIQVAETASTFWDNFLLKHHDAILGKIKDDISFESFMDLRNSLFSGSAELFPKETVEKAIEKSSHILHDMAIRKAMSQNRPAKKHAKQLQFSQFSRQSQPSKHSRLQPCRQSSGKGSSSIPSSGSKIPSPSGRHGRGKKFEGFSLLSQPEVGGVPGQHWDFWNSYWAEEWTLEILCSGYMILFHHFPPVAREPQEFLSYVSGSVKAQFSQDKVDKVLEKGPLELVDCPGLSFCNWLSGTEGNEEMAAHDWLVESEWAYHFHQVHHGDSVVGLGIDQEGGYHVLIGLMDAYFQIPIHLDSWPYLQIVLQDKVYQFKALCFSLATAPQVLTRVFTLVLERVHLRGILPLRYLGDWLVIAELVPLLLQHQEHLLQLYWDLGIVINWEKSDLKLSSRAQYLGMLMDTIKERVSMTNFWMINFRDLMDQFIVLPSSARMWQQLLSYMASLEWFVPQGHSRMDPLQWQLKMFWSPAADNPVLLVPLTQECMECIRWWLQE